jgi:hypothetical protein
VQGSRLTDFATSLWNEAVLVTPHHSVRHHWNTGVTKQALNHLYAQHMTLSKVIA